MPVQEVSNAYHREYRGLPEDNKRQSSGKITAAGVHRQQQEFTIQEAA
jgi:hypothetical protein